MNMAKTTLETRSSHSGAAVGRRVHWASAHGDERRENWSTTSQDKANSDDGDGGSGGEGGGGGRSEGNGGENTGIPYDRNNNASTGGESPPLEIETKETKKEEEEEGKKGEEETDDLIHVHRDEATQEAEGEEDEEEEYVKKIIDEVDAARRERRRRQECVPIRILNTILMVLSFSAFIVGLLITLYQEALRMDDQKRPNGSHTPGPDDHRADAPSDESAYIDV